MFDLHFVVVISFVCFFFPAIGTAQIADSTGIQVRTFDFRGQRAQKAYVGANAASSNRVIVVMLRGANEDLILAVQSSMKGLIHSGYERLGLVISDLLPEDTGTTIAIFSQGLTYALMEDVEFDAKTKLHFYQLIRDVYDKNISVPSRGG